MTPKERYLAQFVKRRKAIQKLIASGMPYPQIAKRMKCSRQRVQQIAGKL